MARSPIAAIGIFLASILDLGRNIARGIDPRSSALDAEDGPIEQIIGLVFFLVVTVYLIVIGLLPNALPVDDPQARAATIAALVGVALGILAQWGNPPRA